MLEPVRNVDWIDPVQAVSQLAYMPKGSTRLIATLGQRSGMQAPKKGECIRCLQGKGPFLTCVVNNGRFMGTGKGPCMNCWYTSKIKTDCSHCLTEWPVDSWYNQYFAGNLHTVPRLLGLTVSQPSASDNLTSIPQSKSSSSSVQSENRAIVSSEARDKSPPDQTTPEKQPSNMRNAHKELRMIQNRIEDDFKKLKHLSLIMSHVGLEDEESQSNMNSSSSEIAPGNDTIVTDDGLASLASDDDNGVEGDENNPDGIEGSVEGGSDAGSAV